VLFFVLLQEERQLREALEASKQTAEQEQQRQAAMSQQAAALSVGANGFDAEEDLQQQQQWQQGGDAMDEDPEPLGHNAAAGGSRPSFATGMGGRGRGMGRASRGGRAGRAGRRGTGGYGGSSNGPQWQQVSEGFEGVGESADPFEGPPAAKARQAQRDLTPESDAAGPSAHRAKAEGAQRGPTAAFMAAATAAGARAQQHQQQPRQQQSYQQQWQPRKPAVSAGSSTTCNIVDDAGSDTDSDSVTGPFAGGWCVVMRKGSTAAPDPEIWGEGGASYM
jgi:hypothetical protein